MELFFGFMVLGAFAMVFILDLLGLDCKEIIIFEEHTKHYPLRYLKQKLGLNKSKSRLTNGATDTVSTH